MTEVRSVGDEQSRKDTLVAEVPKEHMKSLFYLMAGRPDSLVQVFDGSLLIFKEDLLELNESVRRKLEHYQVHGIVTSVEHTLSNNITKQFGTWEEFAAANPSVPETTEAIALKWDFLVSLPTYQMPQRHTMVVRIAKSPNPRDLMHALFSKDPEEIDKFSSLVSPITCRVDFINALLAQELVNRVGEWHKARQKPSFHESILHKVYRRRDIITHLLHYSLPVIVALLACAILPSLFAGRPLNSALQLSDLIVGMYWLVGLAVGVFVIERLSKWIANKAGGSLSSAARFALFRLTHGDRNLQSKYDAQNRTDIRQFALAAAGNVVLNIIAGVVTIWLFRA
jgi:hypothetical protein